MRILHVVGWLAPRYGGTSEVVRQYQRSLSARGHQVDIVTTNADGPQVLDVETDRPVEFGDVTATFHPLSRPRRFLTSWSLLADLRRRVGSYDVVHVHGLYRFHTIAAASIARRRHVPYVLQAHGSLNPPTRSKRRRLKDGYHKVLEDSNIRHASLLLCTSIDEEVSIRELGYRVRTAVVPLGVDAAALREPIDAEGFLERHGVDPRLRIVTYLGRISQGKGVELLIQAFVDAATRLPDIHLILAGPDDQGIVRTSLAAMDGGPLARRISAIGTIEGTDKRALLQRSAVLVLASTAESFGLSVAEAMAVGCPVVVSPGVALRDTIRSTGAGMVVSRSAADIAAAIEAILGDPERAAAMGEAGRRAIDAHFAWRSVAAELERAYVGVAERGGQPLVQDGEPIR